MMTRYVPFDTLQHRYMKHICAWRDDPRTAKVYKRKSVALEFGSLCNVTRNIPPGHTGPNKHYRYAPQVVIHEFDHDWNLVEVHVAPPVYLDVDTERRTITPHTIHAAGGSQ